MSNPLPRPPRRAVRVLGLLLIFASGAVVGAAAGAHLMRLHLIALLKHPEETADRILPRLRSQLDLTDDQARRVEEIVRRRHAAMETIRASSHPLQLEEFQVMRREIGEVLTPEQQARWEAMGDALAGRYLPTAPGPPPADLLFDRFDANGDGALTEDEVPPPVWWRLKQADRDGDGRVTRAEYEQTRSQVARPGERR